MAALASGGVLSVRSGLPCLDLYLVFQYIHGMPDIPISERALFVLTVLADGPRHGYGLAGEVAELSHGQVRPKIGSLYRVLDRLAAEGLIEPDREEARDGRLRRYYRLTENGRRALALERPPSPRCDCREAEEPACRHRPGGAGETAPDRKARAGMSGNLERRYRRVLRPLPGWYRQQWERDIVAAFLESWLTGGPAADQYASQAAGPGRAETACVAGLAARVYRGGFRIARPRPAPGLSRPARRLRAAGLAAAGMLLAAGGCSSPSSGGSRPSTPVSSPGLADCLTASRCYAPHQFRVAYGIQPLLDAGVDGRGQTVVLVEYAVTRPAPPPAVTDIRQDLADFDARFGLPAARIQVITTLAGSSASKWLAGGEEVGDTEMVHAIAPDATIRELMVDVAPVTTPAELAAMFSTALRAAAGDGHVIVWPHEYGENLFTGAEAATINSALEYAAARHATVVAGSGDSGAISERRGKSPPVKEVSLPASDPLVLAAGGTTLTANRATGAYGSETAWNTPIHGQPAASAGGFSHLFARPAYQDGVPGIGAMRGVPDVAGDASNSTDMAFVFAKPGGGYWLLSQGGTSATGPFWAGLIALADQEAGHPLGFVNPAIYRIARGPQYHKAFHDITTGNNTVVLGGVTITGYQAGPGWDPVTGWGTPDAQALIPLLARYASPEIGPA
jgi:DNA-binding PadR family transcriptional regulator